MSDPDREATETGCEAMRTARMAVRHERIRQFVTDPGRADDLDALKQSVLG